MVFRNVSPGQEDPSLALHNAIFCTNEIIALSSSSSFAVVVASFTLLLMPCVDVVPCIKENLFLVQFIFSPLPTTTTTTMSIAALNYACLSFHLRIWCSTRSVHKQRQCLLGKHTRSSNEKHASEIMSHRFFPSSLRCCMRSVLLLGCCLLLFVHQRERFVCASIFRREQRDFRWRHLKNGSFEYLLRVCGEKPNRPKWYSSACNTDTQHVTTL